ncbi:MULTISPECIES: hypothetical protein [Caldilinea]|jgi:hypothetical protein|uniref:Uncharacterized protein n=1 Tax=Caldilinea aerophila (strain DSM 14535 / JCM 11387 / NBRC 104270 / STL-6-O1) TaxID=926550 RepID=I0I5V1_CALAS|nr:MULTISPECIES: hypothetical protein [Caldilinea]BAM00639.1 hypothetical protein CLDAP_25990 [Caldilinea aerophila DSM 14535 = NBRC 104270]GIV71994.1 MAG: hypothetical protein KatS3mg049_0550 [Caldilinea sp.]
MLRKSFSFAVDINLSEFGAWSRLLRAFLPTPGTILFTLLLIVGLLWAQSAGALPLGRPQAAPAAPSTGTIAY